MQFAIDLLDKLTGATNSNGTIGLSIFAYSTQVRDSEVVSVPTGAEEPVVTPHRVRTHNSHLICRLSLLLVVFDSYNYRLAFLFLTLMSLSAYTIHNDHEFN